MQPVPGTMPPFSWHGLNVRKQMLGHGRACAQQLAWQESDNQNRKIPCMHAGENCHANIQAHTYTDQSSFLNERWTSLLPKRIQVFAGNIKLLTYHILARIRRHSYLKWHNVPAWLSHWASSAPWMLFDKLDQPMKFYMLFARVHHTHVHREREREKEWGEQTTNTPLHIEGSDAQYCRMALLIG